MATKIKLANAYRPLRFADIVGQKSADALKKASAKGKLSQALLFVGERGCGKTTAARIVAQAVNCMNLREDGEPCGECEACRSIREGGCMDVVEMDAADHSSVEDVRKLITNTQYAPTMVERKVYIIDEVHSMSDAAFNALLKTIEEPPAYCTFILCTTEKNKVPAPVRSRCSIYEFVPMDEATIANRLDEICQAEGIDAEFPALFVIAQAANYSLRDGITKLETCVGCLEEGQTLTEDLVRETAGVPDEEDAFAILRAYFTKDVDALVELIDDVEMKTVSFTDMVATMQGILRHLQRVLINPDATIRQMPGYKERLGELLDAVGQYEQPRRMVQQAVAVLVDVRRTASSDVQPFISLESMLLADIERGVEDQERKKEMEQLRDIRDFFEEVRRNGYVPKHPAEHDSEPSGAYPLDQDMYDDPAAAGFETAEDSPFEPESKAECASESDEEGPSMSLEELGFGGSDDQEENEEERGRTAAPDVGRNAPSGADGTSAPSSDDTDEENGAYYGFMSDFWTY